LACGAAALPPVVAITQPVPLLTEDKRPAPPRGKADEQHSGQRAAELGKGIHALLAEEHGDGDKPVEHGHVAGLDADGEEEQELHVAIEHAHRHQHAEDAAKAAVEGNLHQLGVHGVADLVDGQRRGRRAQHGGCVEPEDPVGGVQLFKEAGQEPERQQLEERAHQPHVDEAVGQGLPERAVHKQQRLQAEQINQLVAGARRDLPRGQHEEEGEQVHKDEQARGAAEVRKRKRTRAKPGHR
jgi:hypothetical protein